MGSTEHENSTVTHQPICAGYAVKQRAYVDQWVAALRNVRPSQAAETALAQVHATFGLLNSVSDFPSPIPDGDLSPLLIRMARAALLS